MLVAISKTIRAAVDDACDIINLSLGAKVDQPGEALKEEAVKPDAISVLEVADQIRHGACGRVWTRVRGRDLDRDAHRLRRNDERPQTNGRGRSAKVVAGTGFEPVTFRL